MRIVILLIVIMLAGASLSACGKRGAPQRPSDLQAEQIN